MTNLCPMCGVNHAYADPSDPCRATELEIALKAARAELKENEGVIRVWRRRAIAAEDEVERLRTWIDQGVGGMTLSTDTNQERPPNFRSEDGRLYLVRCYVCAPIRGRENYAAAVSSGTCAWCGWSEIEVNRLREENAELRRLLANATDPENAGDWHEAREVGWAAVKEADDG